MDTEKPPAGRSVPDHLRQRFDRFLSGRAPSDPLYLTNRTWIQKLKLAALIAVPFLILGALAMMGASDMFHFTKVDPYEHAASEVQAAAPSTKLTPAPKLTPGDLEVVNIRFARDANPPVVSGAVRNNTDRRIASALVVFDVSDDHGSMMGSETTPIQDVAPHSTVPFHADVKTANAAYVLVREIRAN